MKRLRVNFDDIQKAMEDVSRDTFDYFLDIESGEVIIIFEDVMREVKSQLYDYEFEEIGNNIEYIEFDEEPDIPDWMLDEIEIALEVFLDTEGRYLRIPERRTSVAFQSMVGFINTVKDPKLKQELEQSLNGKGAFRKFKDVLIQYPKERKRWHGYNAKAVKMEIIEWLKNLGIKPIS